MEMLLEWGLTPTFYRALPAKDRMEMEVWYRWRLERRQALEEKANMERKQAEMRAGR